MSPDDPALQLRRAAARWSRAEESVMGTLRFDPTIYQAALAVMSRLLEHLRSTVSDLDGLLAAEHDPRVVAIALDGPPPVEPETVVAAALAIRHRELGYQVQLADRRAAIAGARAAGEPWARIADPAPGRGPELTIHVATGFAVMASTEFHLDTGDFLFVARPIRVDLESGAIGATDELGEERVARTREELDEHVADIVAAVERSHPPGGSDTRRDPVL